MTTVAWPSYEARVRAWSATERWRAEAESLIGLLACPPGARVLDVGTGAGGMLALLRERGLRPTGVDRWDGWTRRTAERPVVQADARALPFRAGSFDAALLFHVLAHVPGPVAALHEAHRVLRLRGRLAVSTPNAAYLRLVALPSRLRGYRRDPTVVGHFTAGALRALLLRAGFCIVHETAFGARPLRPLASCAERLVIVAEAR